MQRNIVLFMIKVCRADCRPYAPQGGLALVQRWHFGPARQPLELLHLNLLKDQYFNSLSLPISGPNSLRNPEIFLGWDSLRDWEPPTSLSIILHQTRSIVKQTNQRSEISAFETINLLLKTAAILYLLCIELKGDDV